MVQGLLQEVKPPRAPSAEGIHALTIDLEDYYMVSAFESRVPKSEWDTRESRIVRNTDIVLSVLRDFNTKATFFTVGWVAERYPGLLRRVKAEGHEIACHGYHHRLIYEMTPDEFRQDLRRAKRALEAAIGEPVVGYRAPSFSVVSETLWALDILREEGFEYDSSILPAAHARGGLIGAKRHPHWLRGIMELPMSTLSVGGKHIPFSGGGYFRLFPYPLIRHGMRACERAGRPCVVYLHPWEFDPEQPRLSAARFDRFKHYVNLHKTEAKLRRLLTDFRFGTARAVLSSATLA